MLIAILKESKREILLIVLCVFLTHGLLIFNDGIYWDDWFVLDLAKKGWPQLYDGFDMWGLAPHAYLHWAMHLISEDFTSHFVTPYKLVVFLITLLTTLLVFTLCKTSKALPRFESLWIALLFVAFNPVKIWAASICTVYHALAIFLFLLAALIVTSNSSSLSLHSNQKHLRWFLRFSSLLTFYLSFHLMSLLVFYFGFLGYWIFLENHMSIGDHNTAKRIFHFLKSRMDYVLLPFLFWGVKILYFSPDADHSYYNQFTLEPLLISKTFLEHIFYIFFQEYNNALISVVNNPVSYLLVVFCLFSFIGKKFQESEAAHKILSTRSLFCYGVVLFALAIFPYVIVGKSPLVESGYYSRHTLLTPLPVAIMSVALSRAVSKYWGLKARVSVLAILLSGFIISTNANYLLWQARWIKNRSVMHNLSKEEVARRYSKYIVVDEFKIGQPYNELSEWQAIFHDLWGKKEGEVIYLEEFSNDFTTSNLRGQEGSQILIRIRKGQYQDVRYAALKYCYFRLMNKKKMENLLDTFTRIEIKRSSPPNA